MSGAPITVLTAEEQLELTLRKEAEQTNNEKYLMDHPELEMTLKAFMTSLLASRPDDVLDFAVKYFAEAKAKH
jgi:hypothetical protein